LNSGRFALIAVLLSACLPCLATSPEVVDKCMSGQPDEVVEACTAIIDAGEEPPEHLSIALSNRGVAYERRGEFDKAISDHTKALELAPDATIFLNRGSAYSKKGDAEAAIADFSRSIELRPEDAAAYLYRGKERLLSGDAQQARADLDRGLGLVNDRDPETVGTLNMLVREFYGAKRYEEAIPFAQKVLAIRNATLGPEHAETLAVLHTLASLDWYARKYAEAEPLLKQLAATRE
jgi:tetratricopeptide (TPR) repeat protein